MEWPLKLASKPRLVVVSGWTGAGKSTIADAVAADIGGTVASFDWLMSGLRAFPEVWGAVETPAERQREIGWSLLSRVAEQQLRRRVSCVLDLVAREAPRARWQSLAGKFGASFYVVECICSDADIHRARLEARDRAIPDWYELTWADALRGRQNYLPLKEPKFVIDAVQDLASNLATVRSFLGIGDG